MVIAQDSWVKTKQWIIQDTMNTTVNVLIVGCLVLAGNTTGQSIVEPPRDTTGLVGSSAKLSCKVTFGPTNDMMWEHNGAYIYSFMHGNEEYPYGQSKYEVTRSGSTFELEIKILTFTDSGIIKCNSFNFKAEAVLIVIENPVLHIEPQDPVEGDSSTITCDASFGGPGKELISPDHFPKLEMYLEGKPLPAAAIDEDKSIYILHKVYNLTVEAGMNGDRITCMVQTPHHAFNATQSSIVKVLYYVTNITYTPQLKQYEVGSSLTCKAQGNPPPVIEWENTAGKKFQGKQLQITESMVGPNRWKCTALNIIRGRKHEESIIAEFAVVKDYDYESTSTDPVDDVSGNENNSPKYWIIGLVLGIVGLAVGVLAFLFVKKRKHRRHVITPLMPSQDEKPSTNVDFTVKTSQITNGMMMQEITPLMPSQDVNQSTNADYAAQKGQDLLKILKQSSYPFVKEQRLELLRNQKILFQMIQTFAAADKIIKSRTEILNFLVSEAEYISEDDIFIEWTEDFIRTLKSLLENGADPTWILEDKLMTDTNTAATYKFFSALQNIFLEHKNLYIAIKNVIPLFLAKDSNMQKECNSTVLHALVNTVWEDVNAKVHPSFFRHYNEVIVEVNNKYPSILDMQDKHGLTPLQVYFKDLKLQPNLFIPVKNVVEKLRSNKNIDNIDGERKTALHYLTKAFTMFHTNITILEQNTFVSIVEQITSDNNTNICDCNGQTVLHVLAEKYSNAMLKDSKNILCMLVKLWAKKSNVDVKNSDGKTFLHILAKKYTDYDTVKESMNYMEIIKHVATLSNPNIQDNEGCTVLHVIAEMYNIGNLCKKIFNDLFKALATDADINIQNKDGDTIMHIFAKKYAYSDENTPLQLMVNLNNQCKVLVQNHEGSTMLHIIMGNYMAKHDQKLIGNLVKMCVNKDDTIVNIQDDQENTALHILASRFPNEVSTQNSESFLEMIKDLASDKTRDIKDKEGYTALQVVANKCRKDMPEFCKKLFPKLIEILKSQSNINFQDENGSTVLHTIAKRVFSDPSLGNHILPILPNITLQNVTMVDKNSVTPLSWILKGKEMYKEDRDVQSIFIKIEKVFLMKNADASLVNLNCLI